MQIIGPLLVVALVGLVVLIVMTARRQRAANMDRFAEAALASNLGYLETDDGTAEALSQDFDTDSFARFASPSLGAVKPKPVVHGKVPEGIACLFCHYTRYSEGDARRWFVAIVDTQAPPNVQGLIKGRSRAVRRVAEIGGMPELDVSGDPDFSAAFTVQAEDEASARARLDSGLRRAILDAVRPLGYPVDFQIVGSRIALYPAARNYEPSRAQDLVALLGAARRVAKAIG